MVNKPSISRLGVILLAILLASLVAFPVSAETVDGSGRDHSTAVQSSNETGNQHLSIADISISPHYPEAGEEVSVQVTINNPAKDGQAIRVTDVAIEKQSNPRTESNELERANGNWKITEDSPVTVPVSFAFESAGTKNLEVVVYGLVDGDRVIIRRPLQVKVHEDTLDRPQVSMHVGRAITDVRTDVNVTVSNGLLVPVRNVNVTLSGQDIRIPNAEKTEATLPAGTTKTFEFDVIGTRSGMASIDATVTYAADNGRIETIEKSTTVRFGRIRTRVRLQPNVSATGDTIEMRVLSLGNTPIRNVVLEARTKNGTIQTHVIKTVPEDESRTVTFDVSAVPYGSRVRFNATYQVGDRHTHSKQRTVTLSAGQSRAQIALTGIDVGRKAGKIHVTGSASNVGTENVQSVTVAVVNSTNVTPAYPGRTYFVGTVPKSDFASFDLYCRANGSIQSIPIRLSYVSHERQIQTVVKIPYSGDRPRDGTEMGASSRPLLAYGVLGVLGVGIVSAMAISLKNHASD